MISATICLVDSKVIYELRNEIADYGNIIISATYTHSGSHLVESDDWGGIDMEYYRTIFKPAILKAVKDADEKAEPVTVAVGFGENICNVVMLEREYYKKVIDSYENGYEEKEYWETEQTIIKIGNIADYHLIKETIKNIIT